MKKLLIGLIIATMFFSIMDFSTSFFSDQPVAPKPDEADAPKALERGAEEAALKENGKLFQKIEELKNRLSAALTTLDENISDLSEKVNVKEKDLIKKEEEALKENRKLCKEIEKSKESLSVAPFPANENISELSEKIRAKEKALMWQRIYLAGETKGTRRHSIAFNELRAMERQLGAMKYELRELQKK